MNLRMSLYLWLLWSTGARISEISGMTVGDLDMPGNRIKVSGKRGRERYVGFSASCREALLRWLEHYPSDDPEMPLLPVLEDEKPIKKAIGERRLWVILHERAKRRGLKSRIHPHAFRHTLAIRMHRQGIPIKMISNQLGHASIAQTDEYLQAMNDDHIQAAMNMEPPQIVDELPGNFGNVQVNIIGH